MRRVVLSVGMSINATQNLIRLCLFRLIAGVTRDCDLTLDGR